MKNPDKMSDNELRAEVKLWRQCFSEWITSCGCCDGFFFEESVEKGPDLFEELQELAFEAKRAAR